MKITKRVISVALAVLMIAACFAGCSSASKEKYTSESVIIGYTDEVAPFIMADGDNVTGFAPDLFGAIFDSVKGDLKSYQFEKVEKGYELESDGGFVDSTGKEYSAALLIGAVHKNDGTFNKDYSYTNPIITNRVIAVTAKDSKVKDFASFEGAKVAVVGDVAENALNENATIKNQAASLVKADSFDTVAGELGKAYDVVVIDEFNFYNNGTDAVKDYVVLDKELETIEYVIACAKNSGWMWSLNEAIKELKSDKYGDGDDFTPLVEKYFAYNASSFVYETDGDK